MSVQSRPYQVESHDRVFADWEATESRANTLLVLPTGTGKTIVAGMVHRTAVDRHGRRGLFLAHREELIAQAEDKLSRFDLATSVEMGDQRALRAGSLLGQPDVTIATVQTMQGKRLESWPRDSFGVITIDEAHHARARTYRAILDHFRGYWLLGITATPDRGDRKNLGAVFDSLAFEYPLRRAIREGYLVPLTTVRCQVPIDLSQIRTTGGDYNQGDLEEAIGPHVEALARGVVEESGDRPTVVFTPDVGSAQMFASALTQLGKRAEAVSGRMARTDRRETLDRFRAGQVDALCCCDLLTEGWDEPKVSCIVVARPTRKRNRYAQMIGRGTRPHPDSGKADCLIVDFAWQTTSGHDLCVPTDLFDDGEASDEATAEAREEYLKGGVSDPEAALRDAEERVRERRQLRVRITGRRAEYRRHVFDPVGVGHLVGVPIKAGWDFGGACPASRKQLDMLLDFGLKDLEGLSKQGASKLIGALLRRRDQGLSSMRQVSYLQALGVDPERSRALAKDDASKLIDKLKRERTHV